MITRIIFAVAFLWMSVSSCPVQASDFEGKQNVTIDTAINDDLYVGAATIHINAPIRGDLVCGGGDVFLKDSVMEDIIIAGGTIKIAGTAGDDVRIAGGNIEISENVLGDLIVFGGQVRVAETSVIFGDLHVFGGRLIMDGLISGSSKVYAGNVIWNGEAGDILTIKAGNLAFNGIAQGATNLAAQEIDLGAKAQINGPLTYWTKNGEKDFSNVMPSGIPAIYDPTMHVGNSEFNWRYLGLGVVAYLFYRLLAAALLIGILIYLFDRFFRRIAEETASDYINQIGYGFLYIIGLPVMIFLTFITVIGIPIGFLLLTLYGVTVALGHIVAAVLMAYALNLYYQKEWNRRTLFVVSSGVFLALKAVSWIPFLGWAVSLIVVTIAFGAILHVWWASRRQIEPIL